jgi:hypothetical protein
MAEFPVVAGISLSDQDLRLVQYWISGEAGARIVQGMPPAGPPAAGGELLFLPSARDADLREILDWMRPLIVVTPESTNTDRFFQMGAAAVFAIPSNGIHVLPFPGLPPTSSVCFVVSDNPQLRSISRQILLFAGRVPRMDFSSAEDSLAVLGSVQDWPEVILLDLDSTRVDSLVFFHGLEKILRARPHDRARCQILVCKDFARPGFDLMRMRPLLAPHAKKIFHPEGALLALLESMIFYPGFSIPAAPAPRSLRDLLYSEDLTEPGRSPALSMASIVESDALRRSVPFLRLAEFLSREKSAQVAMRAG